MIKIEHTLFSAPFMLSAILLAKEEFPSFLTLFWIVCALFATRSCAMTLNRIIDANLDSLNPRTSSRAIPKAILKKSKALLFALFNILLLFIATLNLPPICLKLFPLAILMISLYSYLKFWTYLCHFFLGLTVSGAVLGGWIAVSGEISLGAVLFTLANAFRIASFDIIYAIQDFDFDKKYKIQSIVSKFGIEKAIIISLISNLISFLFFILTTRFINQEFLFPFILALISLSIISFIEYFKIIKEKNYQNFFINALGGIIFFIILFIGKLIIKKTFSL